ncbi:hypothetical protein N0B51_07920 [Tsuneonella sp. YG55]|uniref:Uncharacterized protein n=1 Tax=Tsuneonella litorea TaxID=2976475 RepID=A0A9X3AKX1_9SPHN|nr:hypothetical protein [Tsuneonella litorea]MCT2558904.1 hypothetical protein [Tsuneonella litorea]
MAEASFASLSPSLLARKGGAKPAMRPQHAALAAMAASGPQPDPEKLEDLGWNDMGENDDQPATAEVVSLSPAGRAAESVAQGEPAGEPEVLRQRDAFADRIASRQQPAAQAAAPRQRPVRGGNRAAFTLRLDTDRHLKLRLACTVRDCSAQALVTEALDALLGEMPELEALAAQVKRR